MKMKKLTAAAMTGVMVLGMGTSVCASDTITPENGSSTQSVQATYTATNPAGKVYSVDITWGSMAYTYTVANEGTWDPGTHTFTGATPGIWSNNSADVNAGQVTVTNHSNAPVNAAFAYTPDQEYSAVSGTFNQTNVAIPTAEGSEIDEAPAETSALTLNGKLKKGVTSTQIGTATVTLTRVQ